MTAALQYPNNSIPPPDTKCDPSQWAPIADAIDELLGVTKSLSKASHCFIAHCSETWAPTTLAPKWMRVFKDSAHPDIYHVGSELEVSGAKAHPRLPPALFVGKPSRAVRGEPLQTIAHPRREVVECRIFVITEKSHKSHGT